MKRKLTASNIIRYFLVTSTIVFVQACSKHQSVEEVKSQDPASEYLGTWQSDSKSAAITLQITRDGQRFLFRATKTDSGEVLAMNTASIDGGYLIVDSGGLLSKMSYYKPDDSLVALNNTTPVPSFMRVSGK